MRKTNTLLLMLLFFAAGSFKSFSQTIPVGTPVLEDYYRRMQLLGRADSLLSFTIRPLTPEGLKNSDILIPNQVGDSSNWKALKPVSFFHKRGSIELLPVIWQQQYNSDHPYGWNDGSMIPARGYQTLISAGFFARLGPLSIQFRPEYLYAANGSFKSYGENRTDKDLFIYYYNYNLIDAPERFGDLPQRKFLWGQSSIRLNIGPASFGLSNENIWWGPGTRNSIMMSNNAAGFKHLTLNTTRPVLTKIGTFEAQLVGGRLEGTRYSPLPSRINSVGTDLFIPKNPDWRYLSALNISYHPKWVNGLFFGFTRSFITYHTTLNSISDYIPLFIPFQKVKINDGIGEMSDRDQRTSFYSRWVFEKARAEVYFEYGLNDNAYNLRDFVGSPAHARAYIFGLTKMIPLATRNQYFRLNVETTQTSQTVDYLVRDARSFYYHDIITQGYTNMGEGLGTGIGSGGNLQSLDISWVDGLKQVGLSLERYEHNMDLAREAGFVSLNGYSRSWVDFALAANGTWNYKNLLFNVKLQGVKSLNYQWVLKDYEPSKYYVPQNDVYNFHGELGVTYRF